MDDNPESHLPQEPKEPKEKTLEAISRGTKRQSVSTHSQSSRKQKAHKVNPDSTPPPVFPHVSEAAEDVGTPFHKTPASKRMASHSGLTERENMVYASEMETQMMAEARDVARKDVPWDTFRSIYLCNFKTANAIPGLTVDSVKRIGEGDWEEHLFWERLCEVLPDKVLHDLKLFYSSTKTLSKVDKGKEVPSQPDFILHVGEESPSWADVELLFEHTRSPQEAVTKKFPQWLRGAWSVFQ